MSLIALQKKMGIEADGKFGPGTLKAGMKYFTLTPARAAHFFAQTSHEYLITQIQFNLFQGLKAGPNYLETTFSHPVKEIIWVLTMDNLDQYNDI
jgi:predicted chitinase